MNAEPRVGDWNVCTCGELSIFDCWTGGWFLRKPNLTERTNPDFVEMQILSQSHHA